MRLIKFVIFLVLLPLICVVGGLYQASRGADRKWRKFWEFYNK